MTPRDELLALADEAETLVGMISGGNVAPAFRGVLEKCAERLRAIAAQPAATDAQMARAIDWLRSLTLGSDDRAHAGALEEAACAYDPGRVVARTVSKPLLSQAPADVSNDSGQAVTQPVGLPELPVKYTEGLGGADYGWEGMRRIGWNEAIDAMSTYATQAIAAKQAQIDALMLEYCPEEMPPEQKKEWFEAQVPAQAAGADAKDAARWRAFCDEAEREGSNLSPLLDDALNMGAGVLDMHYDAAISEHAGAEGNQ